MQVQFFSTSCKREVSSRKARERSELFVHLIGLHSLSLCGPDGVGLAWYLFVSTVFGWIYVTNCGLCLVSFYVQR